MIEVDYPVMSPGTCMVCTGGPSDERTRWWDLQKEPWKMGRLYICNLCVTNLANELNPDLSEPLQARILELEFENDRGNHALVVLAGLRIVFESLDIKPIDPEPLLEPRSEGTKEPASK